MTVPYAPEVEQPDTAVGALVENEGAAFDNISDNLVNAVLALWATFSAYYAGTSVVAFAREVARLVIAAQGGVGRLTEAHLRQQFRRLDYDLPNRTLVDLPPDLRLGADEPEVYQRPIRHIRYQESIGTPLEEAIRNSTDRLVATLRTDLQLARTTAAQQVFSETDSGLVTGYRRVIHPELGNVCGLCIAASDRVYHRIEKMQIHAHCKCTILPIVGGRDPGSAINASDLSRIYAEAGGTGTAELARVRYEFQDNGELGQLLTPAQVHQRGPAQVVRQLSDRARELRKQQLERQVGELLARDSLSQWHQDRLEQLQELLESA